jgi:diacylglycerol kinase family enzyme
MSSGPVLVLANPIAGGGRARRAAPALVEALGARGFGGELHFTVRGGDVRALLATQPWTAVAVVGGDGTINAVLNALPDPAPPLAVLPLGTANVLAGELRLPRRVEQVSELIAAGHTRPLAVGRAAGRRFLLFAGFGLDGRVVHRLEQVRKGTLGKHKWLGPVLHTAWHFHVDRLAVETEDGVERQGLTEVLVTCVRNYGGVFTLPLGESPRDDVLHVLCFRQRTRRAWFRTACVAACGRLRDGRDLEVLRTRSVRVTADPAAPCQVDGDASGCTPQLVELDPMRAHVFTAAV